MQKEFFEILDEFFQRATGRSATRFATPDTFSNVIKKDAHKLAKRGENAFSWGLEALSDFYTKSETRSFKEARGIGGMKLVLGGGSHFNISHLDAVRKMLLYVDTILIPDPVLPWLEVERWEERFDKVLLLKNVF